MDGVNRGEHDRSVVRALRSLESPTGPTASERQRIRDRILLALDADDGEPQRRTGPLTTDDPPEATTEGEQTVTALAATDVGDSSVADISKSPEPVARQRRRAKSPSTAASRRPVTARGQARPAARESVRPGVLAGARGRLAVAALALLALVGSLAGMSVLLARDALPGDALYGVKRTAEAASLGLTFGDEPKALKHLEFASARISEIETLARRYPDPADAPVGGYLTALIDFDNDATAGSRQLITLATRTDGRLLESLRDWSAQQANRLRQVTPRLPEAAHNRQITSRTLLDRITTRANALLTRMDCAQITSGSFDDIGALPATAGCEEDNPASTSSTSPPSVSGTPDISGTPPTGPAPPSPPVPSAEPTPAVPPVPVPGATVSVPAPKVTPLPPVTTTVPPLIQLPPLLPGLPLVGG